MQRREFLKAAGVAAVIVGYSRDANAWVFGDHGRHALHLEGRGDLRERLRVDAREQEPARVLVGERAERLEILIFVPARSHAENGHGRPALLDHLAHDARAFGRLALGIAHHEFDLAAVQAAGRVDLLDGEFDAMLEVGARRGAGASPSGVEGQSSRT